MLYKIPFKQSQLLKKVVPRSSFLESRSLNNFTKFCRTTTPFSLSQKEGTLLEEINVPQRFQG